MTRSQTYRNLIEKLPIRTKGGKTILFAFNKPQDVLWTTHIAPKIDKGEKVWLLVLKARQMGISTLFQAMLNARAVMEASVHNLVMAHRAPNTEALLNVGKLMVEASPLATIGTVYKNELRFGKSYTRIATAGTKDTSRSFTLTSFHGSEVAFWDRPETLLATLQCLPPAVDTFCFLESTANGKIGNGELFYKEWQRASAGESDFTPVFLPWFIMPEYCLPGIVVTDLDGEEQAMRDTLNLTDGQLAWRRWCIRALCEGKVDKFRQEYPTTPDEAFIASGRPFFGPEQLYWIKDTLEEPIRGNIDVNGVFTNDRHGPVRVWKEPQPHHSYIIGCDSAMGLVGKASFSMSTMQVLDQDSMEQVAEYEASTPPHILAKHLVGLGKYYYNALLAPEVTASGGGGGREVLVYVQQLNYWNLYRMTKADQIGQKRANQYGWETNTRTRPRMIARIQEAIVEQSVTIHSSLLLSQLQNFGQTDEGRLEAIHGHDDLLFAYGIALMARSEVYVAKRKPSADARPDLSGYGRINVIDEYQWLMQQQVKTTPQHGSYLAQ